MENTHLQQIIEQQQQTIASLALDNATKDLKIQQLERLIPEEIQKQLERAENANSILRKFVITHIKDTIVLDIKKELFKGEQELESLQANEKICNEEVCIKVKILEQTNESLLAHLADVSLALFNKEEVLQKVQKDADLQMEAHEMEKEDAWMCEVASSTAYSQVVDIIMEKNVEIKDLKGKMDDMDHHATSQTTTTARLIATIEEKEKEILELKEHANHETIKFEHMLKAQDDRREKLKTRIHSLMEMLGKRNYSLRVARGANELLQSDIQRLKEHKAKLDGIIEGAIAAQEQMEEENQRLRNLLDNYQFINEMLVAENNRMRDRMRTILRPSQGENTPPASMVPRHSFR